MNKEKFYITTPIYYPSSKLTLGNCYTTVVCDALARFNRFLGKEVFYLTGTDEHGQKIEKKAQEANKTEKLFVDEIVADTKELWKILDISYDKFIRTTDVEHEECIKKIFTNLYKKGDIYKSHYSGKYCTPCEAFWTEEQLVDGKCPDCGREVIVANEEAYFFRLSNYTDKILKLYNDNPEFLSPVSRVNEMVNNFLKPGLTDLCVSRTSVKWGVKVPFDDKHTIYVWIDALSNYLSALGYLSENDENYQKFWPANVHVVGKEIVRFHAIIWPAFLMALDLPLPDKIFGHGWLLFGGDKLSKSKENSNGNLIEPRWLVSKYGLDAVRFYLLKEVPFGADGNYTFEQFLNSINSNLSNDFGNLISRTGGMINKYLNGILIPTNKFENIDEIFKNDILNSKKLVLENMNNLKVSDAISEIFNMFKKCNKYIDDNEPWKLFKDENSLERLQTVLLVLSESEIIACNLLVPFLTDRVHLAFEQFGLEFPENINKYDNYGFIKNNITINKVENLYPRIDIQKEISEN